MRGPDKKQSLRLLRARQIPIATIIDVGVQEQTAELIALFPHVPHILFEPVQEFAGAIAKNYAKVQHTLVPAAVSDRDGEGTMKLLSSLGTDAITHSGMVDGGVDGPNKRVVPMVTLDGWLSRNPQNAPYLVKIDVDGAEMRVLQGAGETLKNASVVVIETPKQEFTQRIAFLEALGFELFDLTEPCYYDHSFWQCDAVMLKRELQRKHFAQLEENFMPSKYKVFRLPR